MKNTPIFIVIAFVGGGVAAVLLLRAPEDPAGAQDYYFDLKTGSVFSAPRQNPPITSPAGHTAVKANIYSCSACKPSNWFIVSLETNIFQRGQPVPHIAAPVEPNTEPQWLDPTGEKAQQIVQTALKQCGAERPVYCTP